MKNSAISEKELSSLYGILLDISSRLSLLSSLDIEDEIVDKKELLDGIKLLSKSINEDVKKCIKLTDM